jgi:hypothetical protein
MNSIEQHYTTRLNRLVKMRFDFQGTVPLEEFAFRVQFIESELADIPKPPIQVAQESDFHWNNETAQALLDGIWQTRLDKLAKDYLSRDAYARFKQSNEGELAGLARTYAHAHDQRKGQDGPVGVDAVLRSYRAKASAIPMPCNGLCVTCAERSTCRAVRPDKAKCNDYRQTGKAPRMQGNGPSRASKPSGYENIGGQIVRCGI